MDNFTGKEELCADYQCKYCASGNQKRVFGPHPGGHYAKIECVDCGRFLKWEPKPESGAKTPKRKNQSKLLAAYSRGFCEICLRNTEVLPLPQVLEAHHIIPVESGGGDDRENVQVVCTACHRLIHHQRCYLGHYGNSYLPTLSPLRERIYAEILEVMALGKISKRAAIEILNRDFGKSTRNELSDSELIEFLETLKAKDNAREDAA